MNGTLRPHILAALKKLKTHVGGRVQLNVSQDYRGYGNFSGQLFNLLLALFQRLA